MAKLERELSAHPEWNMPDSPLRQEPDKLLKHAEEVRAHAAKLFWNDKTGRFVCGIDVDGKSYDYGFTFINCEAIYYPTIASSVGAKCYSRANEHSLEDRFYFYKSEDVLEGRLTMNAFAADLFLINQERKFR